ncbi:ABC transporter permease [Kineothrix sp. MB12-C1]|uniref:ABC transporter permease n=1 Tax=Kineothrix sp. MB12-C1 TaxID=3070215 RepID=UPI0027D34E55|nr:ABC transporter permease [Kineothrix sp. MB12-C1]WMC93924.1 ABC transporter permease [Kineothrix sp. MB12-C1]
MSKEKQLIKSILNSILPILLAFIIGGIVIAGIGENPLSTYWILLEKSFLTSTGFMNTLHYASPLIITGLAIAVTFKANLYNMGVEGQLLLGGFFAGICGAYIHNMNPLLHKLICFAVGILCGMLFALIPAILKAKCGVNEMVVTLMLNYAMAKLLEFLSTGVFRDLSSGYVATPTIAEGAMFSRFGRSRLTMFFFIAIVVLIIMYIVMKKSKLGYELTALGMNPEFSEAVGMNTGKKTIVLMLLSGALAGLAGAGFMMSEQFKYTLSFSGTPGLGWDGMLIALLGGHSPIGILIAAVFYSALKTGSDNINMYTNVPKEIVALIQGLIILFLAVKFISDNRDIFARFKKVGKDKKEAA